MSGLYEDPWGTEASEGQTANSEGADTVLVASPVDFRMLTVASLAAPPPQQNCFPSLHSLCLGLLGEYLEELPDAGPAVAELLTSQEKAALLAVARRRGILGDDLLAFLWDEELPRLEVSHSAVTSGGLFRLLPQMSRLQHLSLIGVNVEQELLQGLDESCPDLITLRIGGFSRVQQKTVCKALLRLSIFSETTTTTALDDWESAFAAPEIPRQLSNLRYLVWPDAACQTVQLLQEACPRLVINPSRKRFRNVLPALRLPPEADVCQPLDMRDAELLPVSLWETFKAAAPEDANDGRALLRRPPQRLSVAERFKLAYREQDQRRALKAEKNRKQAWRRFVLEHSTEMLIQHAESLEPLKSLKL